MQAMMILSHHLQVTVQDTPKVIKPLLEFLEEKNQEPGKEVQSEAENSDVTIRTLLNNKNIENASFTTHKDLILTDKLNLLDHLDRT